MNTGHGAFVAVCLLAGASQGAQILNNRAFENANHSLNWTVNAPVVVTQYPGNWNVPGPVPTGNGPWGLEAVSNGGTSQGNATQTVAVVPGVYQFSASVWTRVYDSPAGDGNPSRARFRLLVDGVQVEQIDLLGPNTAGWTPWTQLQTQVFTMQVNSSLGVFIQLRGEGTGGWGQAVADVFSLDAVLVPEPASLLLVGLGGLSLTHRRRKPV